MTQGEVEQAVAYYKRGYTCTQSILATFADRYGLQKELALRMGEPFGAGTSCTNDMCGSVTGAIMVLGLQFGSFRCDNEAARYLTYRKVNELIQKFKGLHGSVQCGDLLGYDLSDPQQLQTVWQKGIFMELCPILVRDAAQILIELIGMAIADRPG